MVVENKYLRKAIEKTCCVVLVKTCHISERKGRVDYISPNASMLGMNVELLNKGLKLTEDYIYPADRELVMKTLINAMKDKVKDYVHEYRMVGDDGQVYNVTNEICLSEAKGDYITVECYMRKSSDEESDKNKVQLKNKSYKDTSVKDKSNEYTDIEGIGDGRLIEVGTVQRTMQIFAKLSNLYSVFVDTEGKIVFEPTGPSTNMGDFYDLFEKPAYKKYYKYIKRVVAERDEPTMMDREEGGGGKISAAPITVGEEQCGLWILGSYTEEETDKLSDVYEDQWAIAETISEYLYKSRIIEVETAKARGAGKKLREELARQSIVNSALNKINNKLTGLPDEAIEETMREVGLQMDIDKVILYTYGIDRPGAYDMRNYWDVSGEAPDEALTYTLPKRMDMVVDGIAKGEGAYIVDNTNMTEESKLNLMRYNFKAVIAYPIYLNGKFYGIIFFAECKSERVWTKEERRFTQSISLVIQNMLENAEGDDNIRNVNKHLIETYNNFKVGIFVRDTKTGKVLFSNKTMNEMIGSNFEGRDSRELITDLHDRFDNITGMRKPFITKNKITNWRSYIQKLDDIMDITEIQIQWLKGERASLIILRKAKDK